jgi:hypothetical protein
MEFWLTLFGIAAFICIFPYIRCFFKRIICAFKIKILCLRKKYVLHPTHPLWFWGFKGFQKCDFHIETPEAVYSIKLFGTKKRPTMLVLQGENKYFIRRFIVIMHYMYIMLWPVNSKLKEFPKYDFDYKRKGELQEKKQRRILLVNPVSMTFRKRTDSGNEYSVNDGDVVNGMELHSLPNLLKNLKNEI